MKKRIKKWIAFLLVLVLCCATSSSVLAADNTIYKKPAVTKKEYVDVVDEQGNIITLLIEENTYYPNGTVGLRAATTHEVGEIKTYNVRIANGDIGLLGGSATTLSVALKNKLGTLAGKAIAQFIGTTIAGNLATIATITSAIVILNIISGKSGFNVSVTLKWTHFQHRIQGIDLYDWNLEKVKVTTY